MISLDLFEDLPPAAEALRVPLAPRTVRMRSFALEGHAEVLQAVESVMAQAPPQVWQTPGGGTMSVTTTRCGPLGWPAMPNCLAQTAQRDVSKDGALTKSASAMSPLARPLQRKHWKLCLAA